jgi:phage FluMu gp28-like protein
MPRKPTSAARTTAARLDVKPLAGLPRGGYFMPFQQAWINATADICLWEKSRQIGASYATAFEQCDRCLRHPGLTIWHSSRDKFTAQEYVQQYIAHWCAALNIEARGLNAEEEVVDVKHGISAFVVRFREDSRIVSLSSTPEAFAGKPGDVSLDECDLHDDFATLWTMAFPCTSWGGRLQAWSAYNPLGSSATPWAKLIADRKAGVRLGQAYFQRTDIDGAIRDGIVDRINQRRASKALPPLTAAQWRQERRDGCLNETGWRTQFLVLVGDDKGAALPYALLDACGDATLNDRVCRYPDVILPAPSTVTGTLYAGFDVGRRRNLSVIWLDEMLGELRVCRSVIEMADVPFRDQKHVLYRVLDLPRFRRACIDENGIGMNLAEDAAIDRPGMAEPFAITGPSKTQLIERVRGAFEDRGHRIPTTAEIREDLHLTQRTVQGNGRISYDAREDDEGAHADRFIALCLAHQASLCNYAAYFAPFPIGPTAGRGREAAILRGAEAEPERVFAL